MSEAVMTAVLGRCVACGKPYRVEIPGAVPPGWPVGVIASQRGVELPWCGCRAGVPCELNRGGWPKCGLGKGECRGHEVTAIRWAAVKAIFKPERRCDGTCHAATGTRCVCCCNGANHGRAHAVAWV